MKIPLACIYVTALLSLYVIPGLSSSYYVEEHGASLCSTCFSCMHESNLTISHTTCTFKTWNSLCFCCLMMFNGKVCSIGLLDTEAVFICLRVFFLIQFNRIHICLHLSGWIKRFQLTPGKQRVISRARASKRTRRATKRRCHHPALHHSLVPGTQILL